MSWLSNAAAKVSPFLKQTGLISKAGNMIGQSGLVKNPMLQSLLAGATNQAASMGYGRRRARRGMGIKLAGGALRLAGARRY
jgi:hypothetical protein